LTKRLGVKTCGKKGMLPTNKLYPTLYLRY